MQAMMQLLGSLQADKIRKLGGLGHQLTAQQLHTATNSE
jgi:hypothetical protein